MTRWTVWMTIAAVCGIILVGCSTSQGPNLNPIAPGTTGQNELDSNGQAQLWGYWDIYIDVENQSVEADLNRSAMFTANVTTFVNKPATNLGFDIHGTPVTSEFIDVDIDVSITHPFPGLNQYDGYDVKGVFMGEGTSSLAYDTDLMFATSGADQEMFDFDLSDDPDFGYDDPNDGLTGMPDGFTRWFNAQEFEFAGLFGYTPGVLATKEYTNNLTATLNPYKYFADDLDVGDDLFTWLEANPDTSGVFTAGAKNTRNYYLRFPLGINVKYGYAVIANWEGEEVHPSNAIEAQTARATTVSEVYYVDGTDNGGQFAVDLDVWGWEYQPSTIFVESAVLSSVYELTVDEMIPTGSGDSYSTYHFEIEADNVTSNDMSSFWVIPQYDGFTYASDFTPPGSYPEVPLASFFKFDLDVLDESPCDDNIVTSIYPDYTIPDLQMNDVIIEGDLFYDGPSLGVVLRMDGETDIEGTDVTWFDDQTIFADFDLTGAALGFWDVVVTNGCGGEGIGEDLLEIYECGTLEGMNDWRSIIVYGSPDIQGNMCGMAGTQTGPLHGIGVSRYGDDICSSPLTYTSGGANNYTINIGAGTINRDIVCDSNNNVFFTDTTDLSRLRYVPFDASSGFGAFEVFGNLPSGWVVNRFTLDAFDNPVVFAQNGSLARVFHWNHLIDDWDETDIPTSSIGTNFSLIGDFDYNPLQDHYLFTRRINSNQCDFYAIDSDGVEAEHLTDIFQGQLYSGTAGLYVDIENPGCGIVAWGSHQSYGTLYSPFTRMTARYDGLTKTSNYNFNFGSPNLNLSSARGQVARDDSGNKQLVFGCHYINVYGRMEVPTDW